MKQRKLLVYLVRAGGRFAYMNIFILKSDANVILVCCLAIVCEVNKLCIGIILCLTV